MTATPEALPPAAQEPAADTPDRRGLVSVSVFAAASLVLAAVAFLPATPTDLAPFVLALGPIVIVVAVALWEGNDALGRLWRMLTKIPDNVLWFLAVAVPIAWAATVLIVAIVAGEQTDGLFDGVGLSTLVVLLVVLIPAFAEELAWRGFAVPRLLPYMSPLVAALVLAVPWTILHLPLTLVPGGVNEGAAVFPGILALFSYSVILTWIFVGSGGSVLLTGLVHAGLNGVVPIFQNLDPAEAWLWRAIIAAVIAVLVVLLTDVRRRRSGTELGEFREA
jgi:membrane protease YdiL (CAAX protease family)